MKGGAMGGGFGGAGKAGGMGGGLGGGIIFIPIHVKVSHQCVDEC